MAFGVTMMLFIALQESWRGNFTHAILFTSFMLLCVVRGFMRWRSQPRFLSLQNFPIGVATLLAVMTLFFFNWHQYLARVSNDDASIIDLGNILAFDLVVTIAYAVLAGVLLWKRRA